MRYAACTEPHTYMSYVVYVRQAGTDTALYNSYNYILKLYIYIWM